MYERLSDASARNVLIEIRKIMVANNFDAIIIPSEDSHFNEYVSDYDKRRQFITGFTGSAGTAVLILKSKVNDEVGLEASLFTDSRYFIQASNELYPDFKLMKTGEPGFPSLEEYLIKSVLSSNSQNPTIGIDPLRTSTMKYDSLKYIFSSTGISVKFFNENPVDIVWESIGTRPKKSCGQLFLHPLKYAGRTTSQKIFNIKLYLATRDFEGIVLTALDEIAWLFNLRGADVPFNTLFESFSILTTSNFFLFMDSSKIKTTEVIEYLDNLKASENLVVLDYSLFLDNILQLTKNSKKPIVIDRSKCSAHLFSLCPKLLLLDLVRIPISRMKSIKNENELEGMRSSYIKDSIAIIQVACWLKHELKKGAILREYDVSCKLEEFRKKQPNYICPSFETIAASGSNAAIVHYRPDVTNSKQISINEVFLIDCGGQFLEGTTDTTRTFCFSEVDHHQKECFTLALKGHIELSRAVFPENTSGNKLDTLARMHLWRAGLTYKHGTGHGVGCCNVVHEGPHGIGAGVSGNQFGLIEGLVVTNEPGYYEKGNFGLRIESLMVTKKMEFSNKNTDSDFCYFEPLTFVPIDRKLILKDMLTNEEINWLDKYHKKTFELLSPMIAAQNDEDSAKIIECLHRACLPLNSSQEQ